MKRASRKRNSLWNDDDGDDDDDGGGGGCDGGGGGCDGGGGGCDGGGGGVDDDNHQSKSTLTILSLNDQWDGWSCQS